jgi:hypothetical protein
MCKKIITTRNTADNKSYISDKETTNAKNNSAAKTVNEVNAGTIVQYVFEGVIAVGGLVKVVGDIVLMFIG